MVAVEQPAKLGRADDIIQLGLPPRCNQQRGLRRNIVQRLYREEIGLPQRRGVPSQKIVPGADAPLAGRQAALPRRDTPGHPVTRTGNFAQQPALQRNSHQRVIR